MSKAATEIVVEAGLPRGYAKDARVRLDSGFLTLAGWKSSSI